MATAQPDALSAAILGPDLLSKQYALQRAQQYAQLLQQKAMQQSPAGEMVSGHYVPTFSGVQNLGNALMYRNAVDDLPQMQADVAKDQMDATTRMFGGGAIPQENAVPAALAAGAAQGDVGPTVGNAKRLGAALSGNGQPMIPRLNGMDPRQSATAFMSMGPGDYMKAVAGQLDPTQEAKRARELGVDVPTQLKNYNAKEFKSGFIDPVNVRPSGTLYDPVNNVPLFTAPSAEGVTVTYNNGVPTFGLANGAPEAIAAGERARLTGKNQATLAPKEMQPTNSDGTVGTQTVDQLMNGDPSLGRGLDISKLTEQERNLLRQSDPAAYEAGVKRFEGSPKGVGAPWGAQQGAENAQTELSKRWSALQESNSTAQTTTSYLQSIKELAKKANSGQMSDKLAYINGLLTPFSEKANDEKTAYDLLKKYSNQITARLGGASTDAGRAIIESAFPNAKMNPDAITEAVDNLIGSNEMVKAKTRFLQSHAMKRDPRSYAENETQFDQNADPRVWQLKSMDPSTQAAFVKKMDPSAAADLLRRIQALKQLKAY